MSYEVVGWQNEPSTATALSAENFNHMDQGIYDAANTADSAAAGVAALQGLNYAPIPVTLAADMTDQNKIYVYLGSEAGYQSGHWYYWSGSAWTVGGGYNSLALVTDKTLTLADDAADAKATGKVRNEFEQLSITGVMNLPGDWERGYTNMTTGVVETGQNYRLTHKNWIKFTQDVTLTIDTGYQYNVLGSDLTVITSTTTSPVTIPAGTGFRVNIRKQPEVTSTPADIAAFSSALKVSTVIDTINDRIDDCVDNLNICLDAHAAIANNTDLNNVTDIGFYPTGYSSEYGHDPIGKNHRRMLMVFKNASLALFGQIIVDEDSGNIYTRAYAEGAWCAWKSKFDSVLGVIDTEKLRPKNLDTHSHTIAHRGVPNSTPAATKPSYVKAKQMGLLIAEGDVRFTSDNVPILFHDATYTVNGVTHTIANETYEQFMEYDIGAAFSPAFAGTYGLTLSEFLDLCNDLHLYPTIEFKVGTTQQVNDCLAIIDSKRVKVFNYKASVANLKTIIDHDPYASVRLGADDYSNTLKNNLIDLLAYGGQKHQVHCIFAYGYGSWTSEQIAACRATGAIMGVSSINNNTQLQALTEDVDIIFTEHGFNATMYKTINAMVD